MPLESPPAGGPELTVEELAPLWRISEYTLREWAGQGLIPGSVQRGGRWRFPPQPQLKAPIRPGALVGVGYRLVDLADYPLTPSAMAFRWNCAESTIRAWARQRRMRPRVWLARGWRFAESVALLHAVTPGRPSRSRGPRDGRSVGGTPHAAAADAPDGFAALATLTYKDLQRKTRR